MTKSFEYTKAKHPDFADLIQEYFMNMNNPVSSSEILNRETVATIKNDLINMTIHDLLEVAKKYQINIYTFKSEQDLRKKIISHHILIHQIMRLSQYIMSMMLMAIQLFLTKDTKM